MNPIPQPSYKLGRLKRPIQFNNDGTLAETLRIGAGGGIENEFGEPFENRELFSTGTVQAVNGGHYTTGEYLGTVTFLDPETSPVEGVFFVRLQWGSAVVGGVTYTADANALTVITRYVQFGGWTTRVSTATTQTVQTALDALTATDVANAIVAANANGAVSREWFTQFAHANSAIGIGWDPIAGFSGVGTNSLTTVDGIGSVLVCSCGTVASTYQRAGLLSSNVAAYQFGSLYAFKLAASVRVGATPYSGGLSGNMVFGFHDASGSIEAVDGAYFQSVDGGNWLAITSSNNVRTTTDTGIACDTTWRALMIDVNLAGTSVVFTVDGVVKATHSTNIPTGAGRQTAVCLRTQRISATGTAVEIQSRWAFLRTTSAAALFTN